MGCTSMKRLFSLFFSLLLAVSACIQTRQTGESTPTFTDPPQHEKEKISLPAFAAGTYDLVVSPDGDDGADGTLASPLRTIEEAKKRLRVYKENGTDCGEVHVWLRGGLYTLRETLSFDENDLDNVNYCAYPGETPVLSGGEVLRGGWETVTVNGVSAWRRPVTSDFSALNRMDGRTIRRTRYPESGYFYVNGQCFDGALYTENTTPWKGYMLGERAFRADKRDLKDWASLRNPTDILVRMMHYWKDEMLPVERYDEASGILYSTKYCSMSPHAGDRYILENVFEALNEPGEWYLDRKANMLYYVPFETDEKEVLELYTGFLEKAINLYNVKNISFTGITIANTGWHPLLPNELTDFVPGIEHPQAAFSTPACVTAEHVSGVRFDACSFRNIGFSAVRFKTDAQDCSITRCLFADIGGNAVYTTKRAPTLITVKYTAES